MTVEKDHVEEKKVDNYIQNTDLIVFFDKGEKKSGEKDGQGYQ